MKQLIGGLLVVFALAMLVAAFRSSPGSTLAQDDSAASQSSAIADLQTRVAVLETAVAGGGATEESDAAGRPALSLTPAAAGGAILFEEPQASGFTQWTEGYFGGFGSNQFTSQDGMLVAEAGYWTVLYAPYLPETPDYIVEVEMRQPLPTATPMTGTPAPVTSTIAGVAVRYWNANWDDQGGYTVYTWNASPTIDSPGDEAFTISDLPPATNPPDPTDGEWHTYRVEIKGDTLRMYIDGVLMIEATGLQYQGIGEAGRVGVLVSLGPVDIRAFRVMAWE